jgi:hypothetical protein
MNVSISRAAGFVANKIDYKQSEIKILQKANSWTDLPKYLQDLIQTQCSKSVIGKELLQNANGGK